MSGHNWAGLMPLLPESNLASINVTKKVKGILAGLGVAAMLLAGSATAQTPKLAATPPMGWNTWYAFGCHVTEADVEATVDAMASNGMKAAGYEYVNLDDCWQGARDAQGHIQSNSRFPDMKALGQYIHSHGFKFGIYSSPGPTTCGGHPGSYGYENEDAETYASWGVDFLKYDWCSARKVYQPDQIEAAYEKMHKAILKTGRPMIYSLCEYGMNAPWIWGPKVGANLWRTSDDVSNRIGFEEYQRMMFVGFVQDGLQRYAGPGHWNDPDFLQIGNRGLNLDEDKTQMSLWSLLAAPLFSSTDVTKLSADQLAVLTNREVIAVDRDPAGIQGRRISQTGPMEVWAKPLSRGRMAVGLINAGQAPFPITVNFREIGYSRPVRVRDLWEKKDLGVFKGSYTATVAKHGVVLIEIQRQKGTH
ncbi:MAG: glycoside hydrolase family 27 protein [Terracidiphilus sp.]